MKGQFFFGDASLSPKKPQRITPWRDEMARPGTQKIKKHMMP
jgi:hypothetical protein